MTTKKTRKILIIDDEEGFCFFLKANLELTGAYEVVTAFDGENGFQAALKHEPHLILLDIIMPKMNGFEALKKLRGHHKTKNTPIIMLTAVGKGISKLKGEELLAEEAYLIKPFLTEDLITRMEEIFNAQS